jgi:hypothetical protein
MKLLASLRPWIESAASCRAAIHPSVRSSRTSTSPADGAARSGRLVEVLGGLVGCEAQVGGADLAQLDAHPPPRQWQVGVGSGAEPDVHVWREVLQQEGHPVADIVAVDKVVVVQGQPDLARCCGQLVEERREEKVGRHGGGR